MYFFYFRIMIEEIQKVLKSADLPTEPSIEDLKTSVSEAIDVYNVNVRKSIYLHYLDAFQNINPSCMSFKRIY